MANGNVVITGASTGIGRECALRLAAHGWHVFAGVRKNEDMESLAKEAPQLLTPILIEVTDEGSIRAAARRVGEALGDGGLNGLVNNAGISVAGPLEALPIEALSRQLSVNVVGQIAVTQAFLPLIRKGRGRILFMGSILGRFAVPFLGAYSAAKFALEAASDALAMELRGSGVRVSIIEPGSIATPIWTKTRDSVLRMREESPEKAWDHYAEILERFGSSAQRLASSGIQPARVAATVERVLTSRRPRARYPVGADSQLFGRIAPLLPGRMRQAIVRRAVVPR